MQKAWLVAVREYVFNLRRPAFLFATFGAPLFSVGIMLLVFFVIGRSEDNPQALGQIGFIDEAGVIIQEQPYTAFGDEAAAREALDAGEVGAYFMIPEGYMETGDIRVVSRSGVPDGVEDAINAFLRANLAAMIETDVPLERLQLPASVTVRALDRGYDLGEESAPVLFILPVVYAMVFFISTQTTSGYLMSSVVEEKSNRMIEILITTITPLELLLGKIVGLGLLGLTQLVIWLGVGVLALNVWQMLPFLAGIQLPPVLIVVSVVYFFVNYFLYAGIMAGLGSISNTEQESRQFAGIFSLFTVVPFIIFPLFVIAPDSPLVVGLTLFPFTAPVTAIIRLSMGAVPAEQIVASLGILLLTTVVVVWGAARVFRWSLLLYGKRPTPRELWRVIRGRAATRIGTTATEQPS